MTRHKPAAYLFYWITATLLTTSVATAQDLTMPSTTLDGAGYGAEAIDPGMGDMGETYAPMEPTPADGVEDRSLLGGMGGYDDYASLNESPEDIYGCRPAVTESTGSWLRRGWWYADVEAVVLNRMWKRDDVILGVDNSSTRKLVLSRTDPGANTSVRLTLGRFLFRDVYNRDHMMEFTAFGGGESSQDDVLTSSTGGQTLFVPTGISDFNDSFDGSRSMAVNYDSRFSSFEWNYRVAQRLGRDRMLLTPGGEWVRTANEGLTQQYLFGLRYMDMVDTLDWSATDITAFGGEDGNYNIRTNNDLFGMQLGYSLLMERSRWNVEFMGKGGPFLNDAKARSQLTISNDPDSSFIVNNREPSLAFIGEFQLVARYHLRPNVSLKAGWQMMYVTSVAVAPDQLTFSPDEGRFPYTGDPFYNGAIFGVETYW